MTPKLMNLMELSHLAEFYLIHIKILLVFIFYVKSKTYIEVIILNKPSFKDNNFTKNNIGIKGIGVISSKNSINYNKLLVLELIEYKFY